MLLFFPEFDREAGKSSDHEGELHLHGSVQSYETAGVHRAEKV